MKVSERSVESASKVCKNGSPELIQAVEKGEIAVSTAADLIDLPQDEQAKIVGAGGKQIKKEAEKVRQQKQDTSKAAPLVTKPRAAEQGFAITKDSKPEAIAHVLVDQFGQEKAVAVAQIVLQRHEEAKKKASATPATNQPSPKQTVHQVKKLPGKRPSPARTSCDLIG